MIMRDVKRRDVGIHFLDVMGWRRDQLTAGISRGAVALRLSRNIICNEPRILAAAQRKNPPRIAAGGFQTKKLL
jgi:hypothetical protein